MQVFEGGGHGCLPDTLGHEVCLGAGHVLKDYAELLASPAAHNVRALEMVLYRHHDRPQHIIAYHVTVRVVVLLKTVDVEHDEGYILVSGSCLPDTALQPVYERTVVEHPGQ